MRKNNRWNRQIHLIILLIIALLSVQMVGAPDLKPVKSMQTLKEEFVDMRFGMFICYNIMSYGAKWGQANYPINGFNPVKLDCNQWASLAEKANMTFGLLTTKHHEGFCLWDSKYTEYDVAGSPYKKDIVQQYVDAFRARNLKIGLYYSIWDSTHEIGEDNITPEKMDFIKGQITELLTNYGKVHYFVVDGWYWKMGHSKVPYAEIRALIKELQPECLITDHTHLQAPYHVDIPYYEGPYGAFPERGNTMASALGHCSLRGNGWFWSERTPDGMKENDGLDTILSKLLDCEKRYCNFMLNCMPNRDGLLDDIYIDLLEDIGKKWEPNKSRVKLPDQGSLIVNSVPLKNVEASSGNSEGFYKNIEMDGKGEHDWVSDEKFPQVLIVDIGKARTDVDMITLVHKHRVRPYPEVYLQEGNIMSCNLYSSTDNENYKLVMSKSWDHFSGYRTLSFDSHKLRYLKIEILEANGTNAVLKALEVGKKDE